jgi:hypothetical protein
MSGHAALGRRPVREGLGLGDAAGLDAGVGRVFTPRLAATRIYREAELRQEALYDTLIRDRVLDPVESGSRLRLPPGSSYSGPSA